MDKTKIVLVGDYPPPEGGISTHLRQLLSFLLERGVEAKVLDIGTGKNRLAHVQGCTPSEMLGRVAEYSGAGWMTHLHTSGNNRRSWLLALAVGMCAARAPRFLTLHSGLLPTFVGDCRAHRLLASATLSRFTRTLVVSDAQKQALQQCEPRSTDLVVYPPFLASQLRMGAPPSGFERIRARRFPLLSMAHHPSPVYGRRVMLEALRSLRSTHPQLGLAVFGPGTSGSEFAHDARQAGVEDMLDCLGALDHATALAVMRGSDVFIRPTLADGDAVSVREALSLGVRCVASDAAARPEGVHLFKTANSESLAAAIAAALGELPKTRPMPDSGPKLLDLYESFGRMRMIQPVAET